MARDGARLSEADEAEVPWRARFTRPQVRLLRLLARCYEADVPVRVYKTTLWHGPDEPATASPAVASTLVKRGLARYSSGPEGTGAHLLVTEAGRAALSRLGGLAVSGPGAELP